MTDYERGVLYERMGSPRNQSCTTVYIVTSGCYSGYEVLGVFANREDAEQYANPDDDYEGPRVEERCMWQSGAHPEQWPYIGITAACDYNGNVIRAPRETSAPIIGWSDDDGPRRINTQIYPGNVYGGMSAPMLGPGWTVHVSGSDVERVRKVSSEALAYARTLGDPAAAGQYGHGARFNDGAAR